MISFGRLVPLLVLLAAAPAAAQQAADTTVPPAIATQTTARVAALWHVAPDRIRLSWGQTAELRDAAPVDSVRLVGRGVGGYFAVVLHRPDGREIALRLRAGMQDQVPVAARAIARGTVLGADDFRVEERVQWGAPASGGVVAGAGWEARRALVPGDPLVPPSVAPPTVVHPGESVVFTWERGGVTVSVTGTAVNSARLGQPVRARVEGRELRLEGVATGPGEATLTNQGNRS